MANPKDNTGLRETLIHALVAGPAGRRSDRRRRPLPGRLRFHRIWPCAGILRGRPPGRGGSGAEAGCRPLAQGLENAARREPQGAAHDRAAASRLAAPTRPTNIARAISTCGARPARCAGAPGSGSALRPPAEKPLPGPKTTRTGICSDSAAQSGCAAVNDEKWADFADVNALACHPTYCVPVYSHRKMCCYSAALRRRPANRCQ